MSIYKIATVLVIGALLLCPATAQTSYLSQLPTGDRWITHLAKDLLPFWTVPAALGDPLGAFPSTRCDDGSLLNFKNPCPPIAGNYYLMTQARYLVPLSRQSYGYGVAYHLTGDPKYLGYMKAGIDYIRQNAVDRTGGGMFLTFDLVAGTWGPQREFRDPQQLGYGLLGLAFYYYLTRDPEVLPDILSIKDYIANSYYNNSLGSMQWLLQSSATDQFDAKRLVADLDQMNTYLVLLAPILPEPQQTEWKQTLTTLSHSILGTFYSPADNLLFTQATSPKDTDLAYTGVDFGHSSKGLWMIRWTGLMTGDQGLVRFAEQGGRRLFDRAYLTEDGSWAQGVLQGGQLDKNKNWWIYAELDQYSGTLAALSDVNAGRYLPQTTDYWFKYFVDPEYGDVWNGVNYGTNTPQRDYPKAWQWKSAYHDFEHALVGYISAQYLHGQPATLHYAFQQPVDQATVHPYYFPGVVQSINVTTDAAGKQYQAVTFQGPAPVSAPAVSTVSGASFLAGPVAPGSVMSIMGSNLSADTQPAPPGTTALTLAGTTVTIKDAAGASWPAPLYYVSPGQINLVVPAGAATGKGTAAVTTKDGSRATPDIQIAPVAPGIFQLDAGTALAAAYMVRVKADRSQSLVPVSQPVDLGPDTDRLYLSLFATGIQNAKNVTLSLGGIGVPVLYSGAQGSAMGLDQVNAGPLPRSLAGRGKVTVILIADGQTANPVQFAVK